MALKSTVFKADLDVADMGRGYYASHALTIARHPSETDERMMLRLLAFALQADPQLSFGRGISTSDMASRLFVSRDTLWRLERGDPTVALGTFATATFILSLHDRLAHLAAPASDELALSLDERRLPKRIHRPRP